MERSERTSHGPGQPNLGEERDASSGVAGNRRSVPEDEPPAVVPRSFGHACEQAGGLVVAKRQESELFVPVEPCDDTRRPPAELSGS